jgi:hypothetical protein
MMHLLWCNFPDYITCLSKKEFTVKNLKQQGWDMIKFRRTFFGETQQQWEEMKDLVDNIQLSD